LSPSSAPDLLDAATRPGVAIVIISFHSFEDIVRCLEALEKSTCRHFQVVICENGGEETYRKLQAGLPARLPGGQTVEILRAPHNLGYAGGINFSIDHTAPVDIYWILNPDTEPQPQALEAMLSRLQKGDCTAVGHDLVDQDGRLGSNGGQWRKWSARAISINKGKFRDPQADTRALENSINYIVGASMLITRDFYLRTGKMREDYFLYCEEVEWCLRAVRQGGSLGYAPDAVVLHVQGTATGGGGTLKTRSKTAVYLSERNRILLTRDVFPRHLAITALLSLLHLLIKYGKAGAWRQAGYAISGWLAGLRDERGKPDWFENRVRRPDDRLA
jgi:N-acetylglucosaminyl-diphospho-decaprenol L-rhamnosyltransferase